MSPRTFDSHDFGPEDEAVLTAITDGPELAPPQEAGQAARCRCEKNGYEPWLERDVDGQLHCHRCGLDY